MKWRSIGQGHGRNITSKTVIYNFAGSHPVIKLFFIDRVNMSSPRVVPLTRTRNPIDRHRFDDLMPAYIGQLQFFFNIEHIIVHLQR